MNRTRQTFYPVKYASLVAALLGALALWGLQSAARADEVLINNPDKAGRVMLNLRGGIAVGIANADRDLQYLGALGIDFGVAVSSDYNAYLVLTPQVDVRPNVY